MKDALPEPAVEELREMKMIRIAGAGAAGLIAAGLLAGCHVNSTKNGDGKDVNISTPFGGMQVKTNNADVLAAIGLPAYPGAVLNSDDKDKDHSADVNMNFGGFQLRVKAAKYRSNDSPDKVEAFYRSGLHRYGDVIACRNSVAVGEPVQTSEGLTCDHRHDGHVFVEDSASKHGLELKAGSQQHQHIVTIDLDNGGSQIGLVALDLPGKMTFDGGSDTRQ